MAEYRLAHRVGEVADRLGRWQTYRRQSWLWSAGTIVGLLLLAANLWLPAPLLPFPITIAVGCLLLVVTWAAARPRSPGLHDAAIAIEKRWPNLDSRLLTSVALRPNEDVGGFSFLQHEVISEALLHAHRHDWRETVPLPVLSRAKLRQVTSFLAFVGSFAAAAWVAHARPATSTDSQLAESAEGSSKYRVTIEPGDADIERGTSLLVIARFAEPMPAETVLHATDADGTTTSIPLSRSLDDPLFGGRIPRVETDLSYHLTFDGEQSDAYQVTVFDFPQLERADATIVHPEYTGLGEKTIEDVRLVSVIEGSQITLTCRLNKPVQTAVFQQDDGTELGLEVPDGRAETVRSMSFTPREKRKFKLILIDAEGRTNKQPPEFVIDVIPNQPPQLAVDFPGKDVRVSPLEEVSLEANAQDDFGLKEYGLIYQLPDSDERSLKLGEGGERDSKVQLAHQLTMEDIAAQPNELVAYYFYADDVGPDGDVRRTFGDMYFAEVRYFDEEYRQSQSSQGQSGNMPGANTPSSQLLQLQRDIVNATWNLIRRERREQPSEAFPTDAETVAGSQQEAIAMGQKLQTMQEDELSREFLADALEHMAVAEQSLSGAADGPSLEPLPEARKAAYAAYQALLKLNAREHLVQQSQSSSQGQSSGGQNDLNRQLQQLELKNNRNRYETEQQDQPPADREQLQVLNRLRELARRQESLNEKIKELENALRAAESEEEREEIERQLKRLQEEQQQMLRDVDELQDRMNNEQNRSRMADARQQAQDVRENLRRSSEALKEGQTSQALAAGTRAERELNQMKDKLREKTADQFADTMRELREEARELAEKQQQLSEELAGGPEKNEAGPPKLKGEETNDLNEDFAQQRERLGDLMDKLKDVIVESEANEPLLSQTLYDAVRETRTDRPEESLEMASQFLRHGLKQEAALAENQARTGIDKLRKGIEQAAENVLGNEMDSLRRAREEIDELSEAIASELAQADPQQAGAGRQQTGRQSPSEDQSPGKSQRSDDEPAVPSDDGNQQPSGSQPGSQPGQPSESQESSSEGRGESPQGQQPGQSAQGGSSESDGKRSDSPQPSALSNFVTSEATEDRGGGTGSRGLARPLTGADFVPWSDRMRDVEEMVDDPDLRARVAQIRDRAKQMRIDLKRHSQSPQEDLIRTSIYGPMLELRDRLAEEIARREPTGEVVPLDRDPVPDRYTELVKQYYERLGSGR